MNALRTAAVSLLCLAPLGALAEPEGIVNLGEMGCNQCHHGGMTPTTSISFSKSQVEPGETITVTVTVTTPNGDAGGFNLNPSSGTLGAPGDGVRIEAGEATHSAPKTVAANGELVFTVDWTAPTTGTSAEFVAWGNSVNGDGRDDGDAASSATASVEICMGDSFFEDNDGDGVGGSTMVRACAAGPGVVATGGDCDDGNAAVNPGAAEACNGADDDCDGQVDEGAGTTYYADADGDAAGDASSATAQCTQPANTVATGNDCNDADASVNPSAQETCNGVDDDCDGTADDGLNCTEGANTGNGSGDVIDGGDGGDDVEAGGCASIPGISAAAMLAGLLTLAAGCRRRRPRRGEHHAA